MGCLKGIEPSYPLPQSGALTPKLQAPRNRILHFYGDESDSDNYDTTTLG